MVKVSTKESNQLVKESFGRCLLKGTEMFDVFYDLFLKSSPVVAQMFKNTDMVKQKSLLRQGINFIILYHTEGGKQTAEAVLSKIRTSHSKSNLNIRPEYYLLWKNTLVKAIEKTDPKFTPETKKAWEEVIDQGTRYISSGYHN